MSAELEARRTAAAAVLADYRAEIASAPLGRSPGREWMLRLADVLADLLAALGTSHPPAVGPGLTLTPEQAEMVGQALDDAKWARVGESADCKDCDAVDRASGGREGACERHKLSLQLADRYAALGEALFGDKPGGEATP